MNIKLFVGVRSLLLAQNDVESLREFDRNGRAKFGDSHWQEYVIDLT